jgi:hypothetical protein
MKRYKLIKDLPTFKVGDEFFISEDGDLILGVPENWKTITADKIFDSIKAINSIVYSKATLKTFPNILTEWFEEIKESVGSIHWKPEVGDIYWSLGTSGIVQKRKWSPLSDDLVQFDLGRHEIGNCYHTEKGAEKARDRKLAEARLRRTSTFKPDFKNGKGGWAISYDYYFEQLSYINCPYHNYGEPVRYETIEDAEKSIKENKQDWLIYFGVEK